MDFIGEGWWRDGWEGGGERGFPLAGGSEELAKGGAEARESSYGWAVLSTR